MELVREIRKLNPARLWRPSEKLVTARQLPTNPLEFPTLAEIAMDPKALGYDGKEYAGLVGAIDQEAEVLDYASAGTDSINLRKDRLITALSLVADPYRHDVTTAAITAVQDAADKVISGLNIAGGATYFAVNSTLAFLKAISAMNKVVYGGAIGHEDLATAVAADNDSFQAWHIPFGVLSDYNPFDISGGIPAEILDSLVLTATFGANNIIATTAANGTVDTATDLFIVTWGVQGLPRSYYDRLPIPDYQHSHNTAPTTNTRFDLLTGRFLKRTTILNLAVAASNNEARNDANITDISIVFSKPVTRALIDRMRWRVFKHALQFTYRGIEVDRDGAAAVEDGGLDGVAVIDWRRLTGNPYGLDLTKFNQGDVSLRLTMGTTTGSVHLFHEYYNLPDPSVADPAKWHAYLGV